MKTRKNKSREKARKSLFNSESAGATVIAAVLLLSIIFTVLTVVRTEYVPQWKTDAEQSHMSEVQNDMAELKSTVDMVSLFTTSDQDSSAYGYSVTVPFSMGGGEIPVLEPSKSSGTLSVNTERYRMTITPKRASVTESPQIVDCGGITYYSNNRQYMDQVFRYENGALILSQGERSLMRQVPSFSIQQTEAENYTVSIQAIEIKSDADSISSNTDASLRLTGLSARPIYDSTDSEAIDSFTCTILTKYPDAWISYLKETAENAGLEYGTDYELDKIGSDTVYFSFLSTKNLDRLYISKSVVQAELGAGGSLDYDNYGTGGGSLPTANEKINMYIPGMYYFETFTGKNTDSKNTVTIISPAPNPGLLTDNDSDYVLPSNSQELHSYEYLNEFSENLDKNGVIELNLGFENYKVFEPQPSSATVRMIYRFSDITHKQTINVAVSGVSSGNFQPENENWNLYKNTFPVSVTNPEDLTLSIKVTSPQNVKGNFSIDYLDIYLS